MILLIKAAEGLRRLPNVVLGSGMNTWQVYGKRPVERGVESGPPPHLIGEAILAGKRESASGLIYWTGKKFRWYQQGD